MDAGGHSTNSDGDTPRVSSPQVAGRPIHVPSLPCLA